jgi:TonB family protein
VNRLIYFVALSIIIHLSLRSGVFTLAHYFENKKRNPAYEVVLVDKPEESKPEPNFVKPIIKQLDTPANQIINDQSLARFDSEKTQRVRQETKVRQIGLTRNAAQASSEKKQKPNQDEQGDLPEFTRMNLSTPARDKAQSAAISSQLPSDIKFSDATNLNTDANTYYTFYSRVEELFYVRWSERLYYYWERLSYDFKKHQLSGRVWSTVIEVWLTSSGEYHSSYIQQSSGYKPFDEATVYAFKNARFFPNPPRAKVESDGFVRLKYRFNVHIGPLP